MVTVIRVLLLTVEVVTAFLLIGVILLQRSKQQGAGMMFGAGVGESLFGAQVGNVLTRTTVVLAAIFLVCTTLLAYVGTGRRGGSVTDRVRPVPAAVPSPDQGRMAQQPTGGEGVFSPNAGTGGEMAPAVVGEVPVPTEVSGTPQPVTETVPVPPAAE
jgi:preprotein translocase subunit SecG